MADLVPGNLAQNVADAGPRPPAPPQLVVSDRRVDPTRWQHVIPPSLADELGDTPELAQHRDVYARWQQATRTVDDLAPPPRPGRRA